MTQSRNMTTSQAEEIAGFAAQKLEHIAGRDLLRRISPVARMAGGDAKRDGADLISFSDNDYLGLSQDARVKEAAADAARAYGAGAGASRLITGDCPLYEKLETRLAQAKGAQAAIVFGSGYLANISAIPVLVGGGDAVFLDALSHACMHAGAQLSGARIYTFRHNDVADLARKLNEANSAANPPRRKLVLTETVFSMDGDIAPLDEIGAACDAAGAWLMSDDAHGFGVVEPANPAPVQMGTLSKAVGAYGGYVAGPRALIELLVNRGRGLIYTTGLPPAALGASLAALEVMAAEPERRMRVLALAGRFAKMIDAPAPRSAIVPLIIGDAAAALEASQALAQEGFLVTAIRPPTVPEGTARLRFSFNADHRMQDVERLGDAVRRILGRRAGAA